MGRDIYKKFRRLWKKKIRRQVLYLNSWEYKSSTNSQNTYHSRKPESPVFVCIAYTFSILSFLLCLFAPSFSPEMNNEKSLQNVLNAQHQVGTHEVTEFRSESDLRKYLLCRNCQKQKHYKVWNYGTQYLHTVYSCCCCIHNEEWLLYFLSRTRLWWRDCTNLIPTSDTHAHMTNA